MNTKFIDFHCHSILKPYSKSFKKKSEAGKNTLEDTKRSIWYKTRLNLLKKVANALGTLTKFTQADFKSAYEGGAKVLMVSIDPMERELILSKNRKKKRKSGKLILNLIQGIGIPRMDYLYQMDNYYDDLKKSYDYLKMLENTPKKINNKDVTYKLAGTYEELELNAEEVINIIPTMEGGHVFRSDFRTDLTAEELQNQIVSNINKVKSEWETTPFFISLAHHFKNGLCGQAKSLTGAANLAYKQFLNPNEGISELGYKIIDTLLSKTNGKRILIDVKHMNLKSRKKYYQYLSTKYSNEHIPIIASHGATNNRSIPEKNDTEINFYKEETLKIAQSGGIFGVQLDARRLRKTKYGSKRSGLNATIERRGLYKRAFFVWRQIEMTALWVYKERTLNDEFQHIDPWGFQVIGSDFDGIVDPLDGYWTHSEMPLLQEYLILQAKNFLTTSKAKNLQDYNTLDAAVLVEKFMFKNADQFLANYFSAEQRGA